MSPATQPPARPTLPAHYWWQWRVVLGAAALYLLVCLLRTTCRAHLRSLRVHEARLHLMAHWRREAGAMLNAWEKWMAMQWGGAGPSVAEMRANTWQVVPYARRANGARRGGRR